MIVDVLRSCYTVDMQFDQAGLVVAPVTYYFAPPGAKFFPVPHAFCSANWVENSLAGPGVGELPTSARTYSNGALPAPFTGQGPPCAPLDWWTNGVPSDAPPLTYDDRGLPTCCQIPVTVEDTQAVTAGCGYQLCNSWNLTTTPTRTLTRLSNGEVWVTVVSTNVEEIWHGVQFPGDLMETSTGSGNCNGYGNVTLQMRQNARFPTGVYTLRLISYDLATTTGLWQVLPTAMYYSGEYFTLKSPL